MIFRQLTHIETAFKSIRFFSILIVSLSLTITLLSVYFSYQAVRNADSRIYVLQGSAIGEARLSHRKEIIEVEARDHVRSFHHHFFTLSPDADAIDKSMQKAFYLADRSAKTSYDNLKENGYFSQLQAANISQSIEADSILINLGTDPLEFTYYGRQKIVRSSSLTERVLITKGRLREVPRSDHNPHGFLIEKWETISNRDIRTVPR